MDEASPAQPLSPTNDASFLSQSIAARRQAKAASKLDQSLDSSEARCDLAAFCSKQWEQIERREVEFNALTAPAERARKRNQIT